MRFRTISVAEDAYQALSSKRRPGESFTAVVRRLAGRPSLLELAGLLTKQEADALDKAIADRRRRQLEMKKKRLGLR